MLLLPSSTVTTVPPTMSEFKPGATRVFSYPEITPTNTLTRSAKVVVGVKQEC